MEKSINRNGKFLNPIGNKGTPIDWHSRQKIAVGTARGLRYLHEDCRVGRVVHRNMQPRNILLTHDYEPLIADFGLARLPTECDISDEQVVGTSRHALRMTKCLKLALENDECLKLASERMTKCLKLASKNEEFVVA
ncbi:hypothetical protein RHGRI_026772 [Rhododendron griersonianum]|uniref:non-specific serine/threonine protein kinase n=1 Tax=Rhododendron griersonianum TaxID=479676 RepID=A0AAV6IYY8_9ERIC|nr:hypothetical protein RHGRI_026772 [Rhododendron griersonianum]